MMYKVGREICRPAIAPDEQKNNIRRKDYGS